MVTDKRNKDWARERRQLQEEINVDKREFLPFIEGKNPQLFRVVGGTDFFPVCRKNVLTEIDLETLKFIYF